MPRSGANHLHGGREVNSEGGNGGLREIVRKLGNGIIPWYESCARLISPFDFLCVRACVSASA